MAVYSFKLRARINHGKPRVLLANQLPATSSAQNWFWTVSMHYFTPEAKYLFLMKMARCEKEWNKYQKWHSLKTHNHHSLSTSTARTLWICQITATQLPAHISLSLQSSHMTFYFCTWQLQRIIFSVHVETWSWELEILVVIAHHLIFWQDKLSTKLEWGSK